MRNIAALFLAVLSLLFSLQQPVYLSLFRLNQEQLAKRYCVNKFRKNMNCHGKCYLKRQLTETDKGNDKNPYAVMNLKWKQLEMTVLVISEPVIHFPVWSSETRCRELCPVLEWVSFPLLKPPCAATSC